MTTTHTPSTLLALHDADPDALNVIAAELNGWQRWANPEGVVMLANPSEKQAEYWESVGCYRTDAPLMKVPGKLPPWSTSLDAIAELEARLTDEEFERFQHWLWELAYQTVQKESHLRAYISARAHLRLIAWVLTKQTI